jgi:hypothetical protein
MASRLYPTTMFVYRQVSAVLRALGGPTLFDLLCLYITGLILLEERRELCPYYPLPARPLP